MTFVLNTLIREVPRVVDKGILLMDFSFSYICYFGSMPSWLSTSGFVYFVQTSVVICRLIMRLDLFPPSTFVAILVSYCFDFREQKELSLLINDLFLLLISAGKDH